MGSELHSPLMCVDFNQSVGAEGESVCGGGIGWVCGVGWGSGVDGRD